MIPSLVLVCLPLSHPLLDSGLGGFWERWGVLQKSPGLARTCPHWSGLPRQGQVQRDTASVPTQSLLLLEAHTYSVPGALPLLAHGIVPHSRSRETGTTSPIFTDGDPKAQRGQSICPRFKARSGHPSSLGPAQHSCLRLLRPVLPPSWVQVQDAPHLQPRMRSGAGSPVGPCP